MTKQCILVADFDHAYGKDKKIHIQASVNTLLVTDVTEKFTTSTLSHRQKKTSTSPTAYLNHFSSKCYEERVWACTISIQYEVC